MFHSDTKPDSCSFRLSNSLRYQSLFLFCKWWGALNNDIWRHITISFRIGGYYDKWNIHADYEDGDKNYADNEDCEDDESDGSNEKNNNYDDDSHNDANDHYIDDRSNIEDLDYYEEVEEEYLRPFIEMEVGENGL